MPESDIERACRIGRGHLNGEEVVGLIESYNRGQRAAGGADVPLERGTYTLQHGGLTVTVVIR